MSEVTFQISRCIANFRSSRVDGFGAYTMSFKYPHRKKNPVGLNQGNVVAKRSPSWTKSVYNQMFSVTIQDLD